MMFNHWGSILSEDYLDSGFAYFFFFTVTIVLPLINMRFIVTLTTDTLRRVYPRVDIEDYHRKLSYSIEVMEFYRLFTCEKKRRPKFNNFKATRNLYDYNSEIFEIQKITSAKNSKEHDFSSVSDKIVEEEDEKIAKYHKDDN